MAIQCLTTLKQFLKKIQAAAKNQPSSDGDKKRKEKLSMKIIILIAISFALAGCATFSTEWEKYNNTADYRSDELKDASEGW